MTDAHKISQDIFEAWREIAMRSISSGVADPKMFPIVPVYVQTKDGIKIVDYVQFYPEMNGILLTLKE